MKIRIERRCTKHGLEMTGQRRMVARFFLAQTNGYGSAEDLYCRAADTDAMALIPTVDRAVEPHEMKRILDRNNSGVARARYILTEHGNDYHLMNVDDGNAMDVFQDVCLERLMHVTEEKPDCCLAAVQSKLISPRLEDLPVDNAISNATSHSAVRRQGAVKRLQTQSH